MKRTPLAEEHEKLGARMVDFSGWYLPVQYSGIVNEHNAVRNNCGIFDTCHMGRIMVSGNNAADYLSSILTVDAAKMAVGRCRYGFLLNQEAGIIDDLIVYSLAADEFMVVVNSATHDADIAELNRHNTSDVIIEDASLSLAKMDIQGPESTSITSKTLGIDISGLRYFQTRKFSYMNTSCIISRTGYTGETGYELYAPAEIIANLWTDCIHHGAAPCGLGSRDTLRLEAGLPLYGHELSTDITPVEAGFMRYIDITRSFIGSDSLKKRMQSPPSINLTPFTIEGRQSARNGNRAYLAEKDAGWITSGSFAPSLGCCVGFAFLTNSIIGAAKTFEIDNGRKKLNAVISKAPFYSKQELLKT